MISGNRNRGGHPKGSSPATVEMPSERCVSLSAYTKSSDAWFPHGGSRGGAGGRTRTSCWQARWWGRWCGVRWRHWTAAWIPPTPCCPWPRCPACPCPRPSLSRIFASACTSGTPPPHTSPLVGRSLRKLVACQCIVCSASRGMCCPPYIRGSVLSWRQSMHFLCRYPAMYLEAVSSSISSYLQRCSLLPNGAHMLGA